MLAHQVVIAQARSLPGGSHAENISWPKAFYKEQSLNSGSATCCDDFGQVLTSLTLPYLIVLIFGEKDIKYGKVPSTKYHFFTAFFFYPTYALVLFSLFKCLCAHQRAIEWWLSTCTQDMTSLLY